MQNKLLFGAAAVLLLLTASLPARAAETQPGDTCTAGQTDLYRHAGGPENPGTGYFLVCDGATWKAITTWDSATGKSLFQVNNDAGTCTATKLGRIRYDGTSTWEYCNGSTWTNLASGGGGSMAIGGTVTSATQGSVLFAGASSVLAQDNANFFWDATNHYLGIGTATPSASLEINNASVPAVVIQTNSNKHSYIKIVGQSPAAGYVPGIVLSVPTYAVNYAFRVSGNNTAAGPERFSWSTGISGSDLMSLTGAGKLGIGVQAPSAVLDVQKDITAASGAAKGVNLQQTLTAAANNDALSALYIDPTFADASKTGVTHNGLVVASGNVGIGTTSPQYGLHVLNSNAFTMGVQNAAAGDNYASTLYQGTGNKWAVGVGSGTETSYGVASKFFIYDGTADAMRMVIDTNGHTSLGGDLTTQANGNIYAGGSSGDNSTTDNAFAFLGDEDTGMLNPAANALAFSTAGAERLRINSSGKVGIGTTSPYTKLEVNGTIKVGDGGETCGANYTGGIRYNGGAVQFCNGSAWANIHSSPYPNFTAPVDASFAWVNQGSASVTAANGTIYLTTPANGSDGFRIRKKTAPATPYSIVVAVLPQGFFFTAGPEFGIVLRESSTGKLLSLVYYQGGFYVQSRSNPTTFVSNPYVAPGQTSAGFMYLKMSNDGTNVTFEWSLDGNNFQQIGGNFANTTYFTTAPDEVGFMVSSQSTMPAAMTVYSWKEM